MGPTRRPSVRFFYGTYAQQPRKAVDTLPEVFGDLGKEWRPSRLMT